MYKIKQDRFQYPAGTRVYDFHGYDYGLRSEDERHTGVAHRTVTASPDGSGPFFTIPKNWLDLVDVVEK